ncbi:MAG: RNA helicase [Halobacteriovoraceae bacterium]|nr:RNA helicase [Halobacteriovoraceae bacterium]
MEKFKKLGLDNTTLNVLEGLGYESPTEIQEKTIPVLLKSDGDFVGLAQTGTGKTAAFLLPLGKKLDSSSRRIQTLILSPTRELANQIYQEYQKLFPKTKLKAEVVCGGVSYDKQISGIRRNKPQIIIGTPGRVIDLMNQGLLRFDETRYLILDEADEMLNMGFLEDVQLVMEQLQNERYIWMFSATMPREIKSLIKKEFSDPTVVSSENESSAKKSIEQSFFVVQKRYITEALKRIIDVEDNVYGIVFCRTKLETANLANDLGSQGYAVEMLHGDMGQAQRDHALARFKKKKTKLMICTDVAARGIDVSDLTHVFNIDLPQDRDSYIHRIGRTGRAGKTGKAITLIDKRAVGRLRWIAKQTNSEVMKKELPTGAAYKEAKIKSKLNSLENVMQAISEKQDDFHIDDSFEIFENSFSTFEKKNLLKLMFTHFFNADFKRINELGNIEEFVTERGSRDPRGRRERQRGDRRDRSRDRNDRGPGRRERRGRYGGSDSVRIFMNQGKSDGVGLHLLLGQLANQAGIKRDNVNNVELKDRFSFFDVPSKAGKKLVGFKGFKLHEKEARFELSK